MIASPARPATARRLFVSVAATVVLLAALAEGSASAAKPKPAFSSSSPHGLADGTAPGAWTAKVACTRHRKRTAKTVPIAVSSDVPGATGSVVQQARCGSP